MPHRWQDARDRGRAPSEETQIRLRKVHVVIAVFAILVIMELVARFLLGLGDPPLSVVDSEIEYFYRPNQLVHPFGKVFKTNRYGMRSDDFSPRKEDPRELRVMVYGDSVINGGNLTDHSELATTILQNELAAALQRPVVVGNVTAGSWGPPNQLAHIRRYGFLDADIVILVLSSHDFDDAPTFAPLNPATHPSERPWSAALDGAMRYLPRYWQWPEQTEYVEPRKQPSTRDIETCLSAEREILEAARVARATTIVIQHWQATELRSGQPDRGHEEILLTAQQAGSPTFQDAPAMRAVAENGSDPFRDNIHINAAGQKALARLMIEAIENEAAAKLRLE